MPLAAGRLFGSYSDSCCEVVDLVDDSYGDGTNCCCHWGCKIVFTRFPRKKSVPDSACYRHGAGLLLLRHYVPSSVMQWTIRSSGGVRNCQIGPSGRSFQAIDRYSLPCCQ